MGLVRAVSPSLIWCTALLHIVETNLSLSSHLPRSQDLGAAGTPPVAKISTMSRLASVTSPNAGQGAHQPSLLALVTVKQL